MTALTATLAMCLSDLRERHLRCIERAASERDASHEAFLTKGIIYLFRDIMKKYNNIKIYSGAVAPLVGYGARWGVLCPLRSAVKEGNHL